ncbi:MAG: ABC transporter ATP-binding protein [Fimbriiglobus sp.]|nr:ABC transporter ATP-binding protein [Fimbriiglobus sp.]
MTPPAIEVSHLCKYYGPVAAVDHLSFTVAPGELVGFLGLNGAGKTTTLRILTTFMPASSGLARVAGFDVMYESMEVRKRLGYLPESVPLYPEMRVDEYLTARAKLKQVDRTVRTARIDGCLAKCRIKEVRRRLIGTLSKGYRQRVGLADSLLSDPDVLLLDEPLSGLDPVQQQETLNTIKELSGQHTILFSSHQLSDVEKICDRVIIIHRGKKGFDNHLSTFDAGLVTVTVEVKANPDDAAKAFAALPGVDRANGTPAGDGWAAVSVESQPSKDVREAVARKAFEKGWGVRRVERKQERLEDTFMRVAYQRG